MKNQAEIKKVWRFYTLDNYDVEEQWINDMAREGWHLTAVGFCRYIFRRGTPGEYIYKIDMVERNGSDQVRESYFNFLSECGIRIVGDWKDWLFLQKRAADGPFDIKNDSYTKLRNLNKIYSFAIRTLCNLLVLFTLCVVFCLVLIALVSNPSLIEFLDGIVKGMALGALIALSAIWVPMIKRLRRKINILIEELGVSL